MCFCKFCATSICKKLSDLFGGLVKLVIEIIEIILLTWRVELDRNLFRARLRI